MTEEQIAIKEAARNAAVDEYFKARPQLMRTRHEECLVEAGFNAAWQACAARMVPLHAEQIRVAAVAAIREVTGCPDIKGKDGAYLVDSLIVNLIEMQDDAAIAGEK